MASSNELQTLELISSEIDESEIKITFANQCIKAQEALANKLREEIQRRKELCNSKKNENLRLEAEIRNAELEIQNLRTTFETVKTTNRDMKKDLLLVRERKYGISERIKKGEKKYEELWIQCKKRYESIPLVQKLMQEKKRVEILKNDIDTLETEAKSQDKAIIVKTELLKEKDKKKVIQLAKFLIEEMPAAIKVIKEKTALLSDLTKEVEKYSKDEKNSEAELIQAECQDNVEKTAKTVNDKWTFDDTFMIPKLQLPSADLDMISFKLEINKVTLHVSPVKRPVSIIELENNTVKRAKADEQIRDNYISCYFNQVVNIEEDQKEDETPVNYANKKLINILKDIKIDDSETFKLVANTNIDKLQEVEVISANKSAKDTSKVKTAAPIESQEIEEIDLISTNIQEVLIPPTQFLDLTQDNAAAGTQQEQVVEKIDAALDIPKDLKSSQPKSSQESKRVTFDIPATNPDVQEEIVTEDLDKTDENPNASVASQLNLSAVSDDFMAIKDMILKKHHLDLSPQFIYAKNTIMQKKSEEPIIKSKFFETVENKVSELDMPDDNAKTQDTDQNERQEDTQVAHNVADNDLLTINVDNAMTGSEEKDKPVAGLLFTHGPQGVTDFDISMSTTGYEEGDPEFPNCLDGSLLLSPKADLPLPMSGNDEVTSQDVPNFLSGFRKTGLSFFKQTPNESNPESSKQSEENNFNFNFGGGDEKKTRGGLFSFFH